MQTHFIGIQIPNNQFFHSCKQLFQTDESKHDKIFSGSQLLQTGTQVVIFQTPGKLSVVCKNQS
jgi:hypothetical protein